MNEQHEGGPEGEHQQAAGGDPGRLGAAHCVDGRGGGEARGDASGGAGVRGWAYIIHSRHSLGSESGGPASSKLTKLLNLIQLGQLAAAGRFDRADGARAWTVVEVPGQGTVPVSKR